MKNIQINFTENEIINIMTILHSNIKEAEKKLLELRQLEILEKDPEWKNEINNLIEFYIQEINSTVPLINIFRFAK